MNHIVSDFIIRIKNASRAHQKTVLLPYSKINKAIGNVMVAQGFLQDIKEEEQEGKKVLVGTVAYARRKPTLTDVEIISKPSLRVYTRVKHIEPMEQKGHIVSIISTSKGVMTGKEAAEKGVGGELLFRIW